MKRNRFIFAVAIQILILLSMIGMKYYVLSTGTIITLRTEPYDPISLFSGHYARLNYSISRIELKDVENHLGDIQEKENVYVQLALKNGVYEEKAVFPVKPEEGVYIKGKINYYDRESLWVEYGIENYYADKETALDLQNRGGIILVDVALDKSGKAVIKELKY